MSGELTQHRAIDIRIANVTLTAKLDALGAALVAVREAHQGEMSVACWSAINRAHEQIAEAICQSTRRPALTL
jgi:hypothetical protein